MSKRMVGLIFGVQAVLAYLAWPNLLLSGSNVFSALLIFLVPVPTFMIMLAFRGRKAFWLCGLSGLAMFLPSTVMLAEMIRQPVSAALIFLLLGIIVFSIFGLVGLWAGASIGRFPAWYLLFAPANFAAFEFARVAFSPLIWFLPPPILMYAYPLTGAPPLMQMASLTGIIGPEYLVLLVAAALAWGAWRWLSARPVWLARAGNPTVDAISGPAAKTNILTAGVMGAVMLILLVWGNVESLRVADQQNKILEAGTEVLKPALLQSQFDPSSYPLWNQRIQRYAMKIYREMIYTAWEQEADILIFTENALPLMLPLRGALWRDMREVFRDVKLPAALGVITAVDRERSVNAWYLVDKQGQVQDYYLKQYLIPFGEYLPWRPLVDTVLRGVNLVFRQTFQAIKLSAVDLDNSDLTTGKESKVFQISQGVIILRVCDELMFPKFFRQGVQQGGDVIISPGSGNWFQTPVYFNMRLQMAAYRAVETRRWVARVSSMAGSAVYDALGVQRERSAFGERSVLVPVMPRLSTTSWYVRFGDWFGWFCLLLTAVLIIMMISGVTRERIRA